MSNNKNSQQELLARIADLEKQIKQLKDRKKFGLVWEDKPEEVVLQLESHVPILREVKNRKLVSDNESPTNILIEGDNYHSLSVLNYTHKGKVDVIFIDPPYNTGSKDWRYNNDYVDSEDAFRHSKWVSFMEKRLRLSKSLLQETGIICVTIDNYEIYTLGLLMDEIFGEENKIGIICVEHNPQGRTFSKFLSTTHEYYLFYAKDITKAEISNLPIEDDGSDQYKYQDSLSIYKRIPLQKSGFASRRTDRPTQFFPFYFNEKTGELSLEKKVGWAEIIPINQFGEEGVWRNSFDNCKKLIINNDIEVVKTKSKYTLYKKYRIEAGKKPTTIWKSSRYVASTHGASLLSKIFDDKDKFPFPKSLYAVRDSILLMSSKKDSLILDFFAGSGTTGHAVLDINIQDNGNRKFILCANNENKIAEEVTYERLKRVVKGYKNKKGEKIEGLGGNLSYYKTDLVDIEKLQRISDESKIKITYQAGEMIAIRENTLNESDKNDWWQIFENEDKKTAIYFKEDKVKLPELVKLLEKENKPTVLYIFGWGKNEYKNEYSTKNIKVEDIPEPIIEVYKEINRI